MASNGTDAKSSLDQRNFDKRGLSSNLPRANILRIEVLDGNAREKFLAGIQRITDQSVRQPTYERMVANEDKVFYGFLSDGSTSFQASATWNDTDAAGAVLGGIKAIGQKLTPNLYNAASGVLSTVESVDKFIGKLTGINSSATGSGTVREFQSVGLNDFTLKCSWYLPEQYALCTKSLKTLYRMAYPRKLAVDDVANSIKDIVTAVQESKQDAASPTTTIPSASENENTEVQQPSGAGDNNGIVDGAIDLGVTLAGNAYESYMKLKSFFGANYTFNPLPVRVSVGHHMDIEPLVITSVATEFSEETFILPVSHRHIPIFATTTITFQYWLSPSPELQFVDLLGEPIYGVSAKSSTNLTDSTKNADKESQRQNTPATRSSQYSGDRLSVTAKPPTAAADSTFVATPTTNSRG
jgi:hypothetical protein